MEARYVFSSSSVVKGGQNGVVSLLLPIALMPTVERGGGLAMVDCVFDLFMHQKEKLELRSEIGDSREEDEV